MKLLCIYNSKCFEIVLGNILFVWSLLILARVCFYLFGYVAWITHTLALFRP